jgi:Ca2+-binding RTX toxin-like protein
MPKYQNGLSFPLLPAVQPELLGPRGGTPPKWTTSDVINGTDGNDLLTGTFGDDTINAFGGNDTVYAGDGDDSVFGGDGNDGIYGGVGVDALNGDAGNDAIQGVQNGAVLTSADPSDLIDGGNGFDTLIANYFGFEFGGQPVGVTIDMSTGQGQVIVNNTLKGENFRHMESLSFYGGDGNDNITGGDNSDDINGRGGNDILLGAGGDDVVRDSGGTVNAGGGEGDDTIVLGLDGDIEIDADSGIYLSNDVSIGTVADFENLSVFTGDGDDIVTGFANGVNVLFAGFVLGNKTFTGGNLNDMLTGGRGDDLLYGGGGNDNIFIGPAGTKSAYGGAGNDELHNGGDDGWMYGGGGNDSFYGDPFRTGADANYDGGSGDDVVHEDGFGTPLNFIRSYLGGTGYDTLSLYSGGNAAMDFSAATIDSFEELQLFDSDDAVIALSLTLTSAQLQSFDVVQLVAENADGDFFRITLDDNGDVALPETSSFHELVLADGGQLADLRAVASGLVPKVVGGGGNDTIIGSSRKDRIDGGAGKDDIRGGGNNDTLTGGTGADKLDVGGGNDVLLYKRAGDSTGKGFDTVAAFDFDSADVFDLKGAVTGIDAKVNGGTLSKATINDDLEAAIGNGELAAGHAVLFKVTAGDYDGQTFLIVDLNGVAGYQANKDLVVLLQAPANLSALDAADFA